MTKLLVSVRDAAEARVAVSAGVDLIDIKEPRRGSLGAAAPEMIRQIARATAGRNPLSVALGELTDWGEFSVLLAATVSRLPAIRFAKLGLAGMNADPQWEMRWADAWSRLPADIGRVAVAYADWNTAGAPPPTAVLQAAVRHDCKAVLLDTFDKNGGALVDLWSIEKLARWIASVHRNGLIAVVAGSLTRVSIGAVAGLGPDYVAVRGAACRGERASPICRRCICNLRRVISAPSIKPQNKLTILNT